MFHREILIISILYIFLDAQLYSPPAMGGSYGCVVTGDQLYSHGNYIRNLNNTEKNELMVYKKAINEFQEKIDDAFKNIGRVDNNGTLPPLPARPMMPSFCTGKDTVLYVFNGCFIQNNKVYIGHTFARDLSNQEINEMEEFSKRMTLNNNPAIQGMSTTTTAPSTPMKTLDFCTEF
ncbi:unnamed protein product [Dracunculus medinensis]|uniref:Pepsin-I3 domain-containing protein n=1 Tax=Dracunculus medinensis TaxID=318479 RepID=A0A0N4UNQ8_DRAME|nr:unnamed protein product [Dracunculus medinensis]